MNRLWTKVLSVLFACAAIGMLGVSTTAPANAVAGDDLCAIQFPGDATCEYNDNDLGTDMGTGGPQIAEPCASNESGAKACFVKYGDYIWVYDGAEDGQSAVAYWKVPGENRHGFCRNWHGYRHWARCNKNFGENRQISFYAIRYNGSNERFSDPSEWEHTSTGPAN